MSDSISISVTNLDMDEVLTYPLAILRGKTTSKSGFIHITTSTTPSSCIYPVENNLFTALYQLKPGHNTIRLSHTQDTLHHTNLSHIHTLVYQPPLQAPPQIRLVYLLASDTDGSFQSPDPPSDCNVASGIARLQTAGLMIQSATAEMMHAQNLQRRTFNLLPKVHVHRIRNISHAKALTMSGMDLWSAIVDSLSDLPNRQDTIDVAVMSFTKSDSSGVRAHTALGGGPLALFGGGSLFTWPTDVYQIAKRLRDWRKFDPKQFFDDSAGRMSTMGRRACTATTIGALLHELGHCLSLPHPTGNAEKDGGGIVARGFDHFDRLFVQSRTETSLPFWDRGSALRLRHHRYLQFEGEAEMRRLRGLHLSRRLPLPTPRPGTSNSDGPPMFLRNADGTVVCRSVVGIGHIGYYKNGDNASHEEFVDPEPFEFCLPPLSELRQKCKASANDKIVLSAIDVEGRITEEPYDD